MKTANQTIKFVVGSSLAFAVAIGVWLPVQTQAADQVKGGQYLLQLQGIKTQAEAEALKPGDTIAMVCTKCKSVTIQRVETEEKGHVKHDQDGLRYVYTPVVRRDTARKSALRHLVDTFFDGSAEKTVAALLGGEATRISDDELDRLADLIARSRKDGER